MNVQGRGNRRIRSGASCARAARPTFLRSLPAFGAVALAVLLVVAPGVGGPAQGPTGIHVHPPALVGIRGAQGPSVPVPTVAPGPDPRASVSGGESRLLVNAQDPSAVPNTGIESEISGFATNPLDPLTAFQIGSEETIGSYDAVFGLFQNSTFGPAGFFEVFTSATDQTVHLAYGSPQVIVPGVQYVFALVANGTTWTLRVNGEPFAATMAASSFDFGVADATDAAGIDFYTTAFYTVGTATVVPTIITVPTAFAVEEASGWYLPVAESATFLGTASTAWGIAGRAQSPALAPGEVVTGTSVAPIANGTTLWTGGPVPVDIALTLDQPTLTATLTLLANVTVRAPSGGPLPGVLVVLRDDHGGLAPPPDPTGADGRAQLALVTPNVTAPVTDEVTVSSAILGYAGSASEPVTLTPPVEVVLSLTPGDPTVVENGSIALTVSATTPGGAPVTFVALLVTSEGDGEVTPTYGFSDARGHSVVTFVAGARPGLVKIIATVDQPGAWGTVTSEVRVVIPPQNPWIEAEPYIILALVAALVVAVAVALRRRKPRALPELDFLRGARAAPPAPPGTEEVEAATRTPPSSGSP
jgi:hypothetical protein